MKYSGVASGVPGWGANPMGGTLSHYATDEITLVTLSLWNISKVYQHVIFS